MTENAYPPDFKKYWRSNKATLINKAPKPLMEERENNGKMNTAGDWLLFILPIMAIVGFTKTNFISNEILRFIIALAVGLICFVATVYIKTYVTGKRNIVDIDEDIKAYFFNIYKKDK